MSFPWYESIKNIRVKLENSGYKFYSEEILNRELGGAMASEILLAVCSKLLEIKKSDKNAFKIIQKETTSLIEYCNSIGLYPK